MLQFYFALSAESYSFVNVYDVITAQFESLFIINGTILFPYDLRFSKIFYQRDNTRWLTFLNSN